MTYQTSSGAWLRLLSYLAWPFMKLRRYGRARQVVAANYTLGTLPKGLKFLRVVPPSESPKVMGLMGIHDPDALCHFNGMTHCPWCGKEGQNEGTVINHLQTVHYRLSLMYKKCSSYLSTSLDTLCCHGWQNCQPLGEGGPNELSSLA